MMFKLATLAFFASASADVHAQFEYFKQKHGKTYTGDEHAKRLSIYTANLEKIKDLNKRSKTAVFGETKFADLTRDEFAASVLSPMTAVRDESRVAPDIDVSDLPKEVDWRTKGVVTPIKNQGACGSCWAFSAIGNIEGQWALANHTLTQFSEQNLVDCDHECMQYDGGKSCDAGCNGGLQPNAYNYVIKAGGIDTESDYPYAGVNGQCQFKKQNIGASIKNWTMISKDEKQIAAQLNARGPLAIAADAVEWQFYIFGIFDLPCGSSLDHGILIVGYGSGESIIGEQDYWIIKNSWGEGWGEHGYMRLHRGDGKCGVNQFVSSSIV
jgi:cathepsin F